MKKAKKPEVPWCWTGLFERAIDGDTVVLKLWSQNDIIIDSGFGTSTHLVYTTQATPTLRINGIDTPEKGTVGAMEAEEFVFDFCRGHATFSKGEWSAGRPELDVKTYKPDKYGRWLCDISVGGVDLGQELIKTGLAKKYNGGKKT